MSHDYFTDYFSRAAEHLRAAADHVERARKSDPEAWARFAQRFIDAGGFNIAHLADECDLIAGLLGEAKAISKLIEAAE